jgi:hypothetical protein
MTPAPEPRPPAGSGTAFALWCLVAMLAAMLATVWLLPGG